MMVLTKRTLWSGSFVVLLGGAVATVYLLAGANAPSGNGIAKVAISPGTVPETSIQRQSLGRIEPGTVVGPNGIEGWSHLVLLVRPKLAAGDVDSLHSWAKDYAKRFMLTIAADTAVDGHGEYYLSRLGVGFSCDAGDRTVVVGAADTGGVELGFIERQVLDGNEGTLADVYTVGRTPRMVVFDQEKLQILLDGKPQVLVMRHAVLVNSQTGDVSTLLWLLRPEGGRYRIATGQLRILRPNLREDRVIHVDKSHVNALGIPTPQAFSMTQLPPGDTFTFVPDWEPLAVARTMNHEQLRALEAKLSALLQRSASNQ